MSRVYCRGWDNEDNCHSEFSVNIRTIIGGVFGERDSNVKRLIYIPSKHDMCEAKSQTHYMRHGLIHNVIGVSPNTLCKTCLNPQCGRRNATSHPRLKIDQSESTLPLNWGCKRRYVHHIVSQESRPNVS